MVNKTTISTHLRPHLVALPRDISLAAVREALGHFCVWPDSGESRGGKVARGRDTRASGGEGRREFIRVPPFVPSPGADKEAASGGRFLPLTPSSSLPPLPSPPPPSPRISRPAREPPRRPGRLRPQFHATLSRPSPPATSLETFPPGDAGPGPLPPTTLLSPAFPARTSLRGGKSPKSLFPGDAPLCSHFPCQSV